ncbi:MAG: DUF2085 domain-containing protein [Methanobacteriota archaeon]|nr:MAG: DUF2085 domain-containing protein [Euryarchaeota archaeon]
MRFPRITSLAILVMSALTVSWLALVMVSPFLVPSGTITDLSGRVGYIDNAEVISEMDILPRAVYRIGDAQCHQLADRSYFLNDNQMPFCARDLGLFVGLAFASVFALFFRLTINPFLLLIGLVPLGVDGGLQLISSYESVNALRLATGICAGGALALLLAQFLLAFKTEESAPGDAHEVEGDDEPSGK